MIHRDIEFEVVVADSFTYPENNGIDNLHLWPIAQGKSAELLIPISFDWDEKSDALKIAEKELDKYIKEHHPGKDYRIYYWWWK